MVNDHTTFRVNWMSFDRNVKHHDRTFEYIKPREPFDFIRASNVETKGFAFIIPLNIRLGYTF